MRNVVLITGIGGDISQGVATILREQRKDLYLVGVDIHSQHGGKLFVDFCETVPSATDPNYLSALESIIQKYQVGIFIPMTEPELGIVQPSFEFLLPGVKWITAGRKVVAAGLDKLATIRAVEELGLPIPWTIPVENGDPLDYPCILKNRYGSGSRAVFELENNEDAAYYRKRYPNAVFQEMLEPADREITCAVYRRSDGAVYSLLMQRRLTGGFTGWAKIINNLEITLMCERLAIGLDLKGSMNVQLRLTDQGPRIFEINPRFSSTVLMRHRLGFRDVLWAIEEAEGKDFEYSFIPSNKIMVRIQEAAIFDEE
jgi:carbamoyl-phosphate synthase large subunit